MYNVNKRSDGRSETKKFENFRIRVSGGKVCHADDIPSLTDMLDGVVNKTGLCVRFRPGVDSPGYIWILMKAKSVYDSDGKLMRVIARLP